MEQLSREELAEKCSDYFRLEVDDVNRTLALIGEHAGQTGAKVQDSHIIHLYGLDDGAELNRILVENGIRIYSSGFHHMDLEEYFLAKMDGKENGKKEAIGNV